MKLSKFMLCVMLACVLASCGKKENDAVILTFDVGKAEPLPSQKVSVASDVVLDTTHTALLSENLSLRRDGDTWFVYSSKYVYAFDKNGVLLNKIGAHGHGRSEYTEVKDVDLDVKRKVVEVLVLDNILQYGYDGKFIGKRSVGQQFSRFAHDGDNYWFSVSGNTYASDYDLWKSDGTFKNMKSMLGFSCKISGVWDVFGNGTVLTYFQPFTYDVYHFTNDSLALAYKIECPELELPESMTELEDIFKFHEELMKRNSLIVQLCLENERYLCFALSVCKKDGDEDAYLWLVDKTTWQDRLLQLDDDVLASFWGHPQLLSSDNLLYFVGYPLTKGGVVNDESVNPHLVAVDVAQLFGVK